MLDRYAPLPGLPLRSATPCQTPLGLTPLAALDDPAMTVMTDFRRVTPVTVEPHTRIAAALDKMRVRGVRLLFVPDRDDRVIGIVTAHDIQGEHPVRMAGASGVHHEDIRVEMIMTPLEKLTAVDSMAVEAARVGDIVRTLRALERQHALVLETDPETGAHSIRGMFSTTHVSKLLGYDITDPEHAAHSLAEVQRELG